MAKALYDSNDEEEYFLSGLENGMGILVSEAGIDLVIPFVQVLEMLLQGLEKESNEMAAKVELLNLDPEFEHDNLIISQLRHDNTVKRKTCIQARTVYHPDMQGVFDYMAISAFPGCIDRNAPMEFVSFRPDINSAAPYILEQLNKTQNAYNRYRFVDFETLQNDMRKFASETWNPDAWLRMCERMVPMDQDGFDINDVPSNGCEQLFFGF